MPVHRIQDIRNAALRIPLCIAADRQRIQVPAGGFPIQGGAKTGFGLGVRAAAHVKEPFHIGGIPVGGILFPRLPHQGKPSVVRKIGRRYLIGRGAGKTAGFEQFRPVTLKRLLDPPKSRCSGRRRSPARFRRWFSRAPNPEPRSISVPFLCTKSARDLIR